VLATILTQSCKIRRLKDSQRTQEELK